MKKAVNVNNGNVRLITSCVRTHTGDVVVLQIGNEGLHNHQFLELRCNGESLANPLASA